MADCENAGYSLKNGRVYCRTVNYQVIRERYAAGETVTEIARDIGFSFAGVKRIVDPAFSAKLYAVSQASLMSGTCPDCGKEGTFKHKGVSSRCRDCASRALATSVREGELRCYRCREWKPDAEFPNSSKNKARRGRHKNCRLCNTTLRREHRHRNPEAAKAYDREYKRRRRAAGK